MYFGFREPEKVAAQIRQFLNRGDHMTRFDCTQLRIEFLSL